MDDHTDGSKRYRMALDLIGSTRWLPNYIYNRHEISVSFATKKCGCVAAYRSLYVQNKAFDYSQVPNNRPIVNFLKFFYPGNFCF